MTTPEQFLEDFLREKAAVYADVNSRLEPVYAKHFGEPLLQHSDSFLLRDRQVVDDAKQTGSSAVVTTRAHFTSADIRWRYHLLVIGDGWKIVRMERECFICRGTGRLGTEVCNKCAGEGWYDSRKKEL